MKHYRPCCVIILFAPVPKNSSPVQLRINTYTTLPQRPMTSEANSSNYFAVALNDDQQAIQSQEAVSLAPDEHEQLDITTSIRALRIAAAVERSKTEYKPEHAYTERLVGGFPPAFNR